MPRPNKVRAEKEQHRKAFELYYAQGEKRSFPRLAKDLGVSVASLKVWSKAFGWQGRLRERDATIARQAADQVIGSAVVNASRKRKMVELALMKVIKAINSDKVKIQVGDLDRLLRLQAFLDGDGGLPTPEALRERPVPAVFAVFQEWTKLLTDEELHWIIDSHRASHPPPQPPAPAADTPPTPGEAHVPAPNPTG